ncbi:hypothetical protein T440DRAFT_552889 [Plenodomus tracheiphilus IPT5]|uniref:N-acetyltransferase domain-containing protein n=1 Tax=Plenodomus tracheiphilus IPT5 TaxID=1408161 RepID=A0A6A7BF12_9PLEO|nr:hypothetical protein T440DRAFT_552889 [Plenodomus tracheiphilus IPT5]
MPTFNIRDEALPEDAVFILEVFDSALPHLASIGSERQWGTEPRSTQEAFVERIRTAVKKAQSGTSSHDAVFIAEVSVENDLEPVPGRVRRDESGQQMLKVAGSIVQGSFPSYILEQPNLEALVQKAVERADCIYLGALVSDFRVGVLRKGAGSVLLQRVKQYALETGTAAVYLDCWAGNEEGLVGFYKSQGFVPVDDFHAKKEDGSIWHGKLMRMDIDQSNSHE